MTRTRLTSAHPATTPANSTALWPLCLLLFCLVLEGCQPLRRTAECKKFVALANSATAKWQKLHERNDPAPQADIYETLATEFGATQKAVTALPSKDPQLKKAIRAYASVLERSAKHSQSYADALRELQAPADTDDAKKKQATERKLKKLRSQMKTVLRADKSGRARLRTLCEPKK